MTIFKKNSQTPVKKTHVKNVQKQWHQQVDWLLIMGWQIQARHTIWRYNYRRVFFHLLKKWHISPCYQWFVSKLNKYMIHLSSSRNSLENLASQRTLIMLDYMQLWLVHGLVCCQTVRNDWVENRRSCLCLSGLKRLCQHFCPCSRQHESLTNNSHLIT